LAYCALYKQQPTVAPEDEHVTRDENLMTIEAKYTSAVAFYKGL